MNPQLDKLIEEMVGKRYGKLIVVQFVGSKNRQRMWLCKCDCGGTKEVSYASLNGGHTASCGCLKKEVLRRNVTTHGMTKTPLHTRWCDMKKRCYNKNDKRYPRYGGRGIKICDGWLSFENFKEDMYHSFLQHLEKYGSIDTQIDRINNDGNYELSNCKWSTRREQMLNKANSFVVEYRGIKKHVTQWADEYNIPYKRLKLRIKRGWPVERALNEPVNPSGFYRKRMSIKTLTDTQ